MAKARKTVEVTKMLNWANKQLAYEGHSQQHKAGICTMIAMLLKDAGCYKGYRYLHLEHVQVEYNREYYG